MINKDTKKKIKHLKDELFEEDYNRVIKIFGVVVWRDSFTLKHDTEEMDNEDGIGFKNK